MKAEFIYKNIMNNSRLLIKFLEYDFIKIKNIDIITIDEFYSEYEKLDSFEKLQMDNSKIHLHHDYYNRATAETIKIGALYQNYIVPNKWNIFEQLMKMPFDTIQKMIISVQSNI